MCGIRTSFEPLGQCILNFACGFLVMISWHAAFAISLATIPVFLLYWKFVPNIKSTSSRPKKSGPSKASDRKKSGSSKVSWGVISLAAALMFLVMCNTAITIEVPNIVSNLHLGNSAFSSLIISLNTLAAMLMGFSFSKMYNILHQFTFASGLVLIACGCLIMYMSKTSGMVILGAIISGISFPLSGSYTYALIGKVVSKSSGAISIVLVGCNLGSFICPLGVSLLGHIGGTFNPGASTINNAFLMMFFLAFLIAVVVICFIIYRQSSLSIRKETQKKLMMQK